MMFPVVGVVGELSSFRISKGAWVYFDLKDETACVKFFGSVRQLPGPLEDGMRLEVLGRPYLHPRFGFSIQIMTIRPVGEGTIRKAQDVLMAKLQTEGLFEEARKRTLPYPPEKIVLITSKESAAYSDFNKIIAARWPKLTMKLIDVQVQGQDAPVQLVKAIEQANQLAEPFDALVMIRGGGSTDDLSAFSAEPVVRAVAASRMPTIVAIGHERDVSLSELAADQRASTPSNAAELLVPDQKAESARLENAANQLNTSISKRYEALVGEVNELDYAMANTLVRLYDRANDELSRREGVLRLLDPNLPLQRGFALVRSDQGRVIRRKEQAQTNDKLKITVSNGTIDARVE